MEAPMGKKKKTGPLVIFLVVLAILVWAYFYFFKGKETMVEETIIEEEVIAPTTEAPAEEPAPTEGTEMPEQPAPTEGEQPTTE